MSWVFSLSLAVLVAAVVLIEVRAVRTGDERRHHAPGYAYVMAGLVAIGVGIAAAAAEMVALSLVALGVGFCAVVLGSTRHREATAH